MMEGPCPRCRNPHFSRVYNEKGTCWWCSQETMTTVCIGPGIGCGMRVCKPCLEGKIIKPPPALPAEEPCADDQGGFSI